MKRWLKTLLFAMVGGLALLCAPVVMTASDTSVSPTVHTGFDYDTDSVRVVSDNNVGNGSQTTTYAVPFLGPVSELVAAKSGIGATGQIGENALKALGGESQVYFKTTQGGRYIDQLANGIANESKVGYQSLTKTISGQISKDVELIQTEKIQGAAWHFFESPVTGVGGPSQPLLNSLQQNGINVIVH